MLWGPPVPDKLTQCLCPQPDITEKYLSSPEYGGTADCHFDVPETKDVKKKSSTGLKLSNLMNLGRKKSTSLEPQDHSLETASKDTGAVLSREAEGH